MIDKAILTKLKKLKSKIRRNDKPSTTHRVQFMVLLFENEIHNKVLRYELFDEHNIGERDVDTCFEMGDGREVLSGLVDKASNDFEFEMKVRTQIGSTLFENWKEIVSKQRETSEPQLNLSL
ncbi:hypothetical protein [Vibrio barjaei]|uniref:hypothetical protein n=1 Tax=Vibrio barjaei TaxID=1676683 RepID=UPI002283D930|nr:hypothetical protein [Vibrio barjaei]MCY9874786.1 hypothetical protein [Vibrio barjaei]